MARVSGPQHDSRVDDFDRLIVDREDETGEEAPRHGRGRRGRGAIWPWVLGVLLVLLLAVGGAGWFAYQTYPEQVKSLFGWSNDYAGDGTDAVTVVIQPGDYGDDVAKTLAANGVVKTFSAFHDLVATKPPTLQPGTYRLRSHMSAKAALAALEDPKNRVESTVRIIEGSTVKQILPAVAQSTGVRLADLQAIAKDRTSLGVPRSAPNLEGWLFPATYTFQPDTSARTIMQTMVDRAKRALDEAGVKASDRQRVLTLAGLVQKEGNGKASEDAKVARVFLNRVKAGMRLQSDATVSYGAGGTTVVPTQKEKEDRNGYNTYLRDGLPVGPISNPGDAAIAAAVSPAKGPWLYFVTVNLETGETKFATTYAAHQRNADEFLRWLNAHPSYKK